MAKRARCQGGMFTRRGMLKAMGLGAAALAAPSLVRGVAAGPGRPNIVLIMADDMGYSDIGCYGGEIRTPNLDRLARGGIRFTQFYNNAKCGPTRASLLTGQYSQAVGEANMERGATIGEVLRAAGYRTICSGKWHQRPLPTTRGFDRYFGLADGCCNFWNPGTRARPGEPAPGRKQARPRRWAIEGKAIAGYVPEDKNFYTTDAFADYAAARLEEYKDEGKPFLLYLPFTAPHYPLHAWPADIARYRGTYRIGWDELRKRRYKRMIDMGLIDRKWALSPRDASSTDWQGLSEADKDQWDLRMAVYAAMIDRMDQAIGKVLDTIRQLGRADNTLVLFLADNGGCSERVNRTRDIPPGPVASYRSVDPAWANASNTPFRKFKSWDHEGGVATPLIAYWPKGITKNVGGLTGQVGHIIDVLPTFMDLAGAKYPAELDGRKLRPVDGKSLLPIFQGRQRTGHKEIFWQFGRAKAVRQGKWKLVRNGTAPWELYDMEADRTELHDLAATHGERAKDLSGLWDDWARRCRVKGAGGGGKKGAT